MAIVPMIKQCMNDVTSVRNVCILAHVDHGKTTIADQLLASNHIVSKRLAGSLRYLDDRQDEQERGITMKSSSVSLLWRTPTDNSMMLLNLVDTPGHIDFATEVAAAVRVCDGAFIVVDVVEGVCVQTKEAIKQAFEEGVKMILIINKFDKLIVELNKEVKDMFQDILRVIEDCNAYIADLIRYENSTQIEESNYLFSPDMGNVIFASAVHGWGFTLNCIAELFMDRIEGETIKSLVKKMWNFDYYMDRKSRRTMSGAIKKNKDNLFQELCLKTIHYVYNTIVVRMERDQVEYVTTKLKIPTITRDMRHTDTRIQIKAILEAWSSLSDTIMIQSKFYIPSPNEITDRKIKYMLSFGMLSENEYREKLSQKFLPYFTECSTQDSAPLFIYISKMFCVSTRNLSQNKPKPVFLKGRTGDRNVPHVSTEATAPPSNLEEEEEPKPDNNEETDNILKKRETAVIALARVFSGTVRVGQVLYFLTEDYDPTMYLASENKDQFLNTSPFVYRVLIRELYILFGRELVLVESVSAGNICGIGGLDDTVPRRGTLTNLLDCYPLANRPVMEPVVHNSIETVSTKDFPELRRALRYVTQCDSCVQVKIQDNGELILLTAGDVHLAKCMEDLKRFTDVPVKLSEPMVSFRETVMTPIDYDHCSSGPLVKTAEFAPLKITMSVIILTLPLTVINVLKSNFDLLRIIEQCELTSGIDIMYKRRNMDILNAPKKKIFNSERFDSAVEKVHEQLKTAFANAEGLWSNFSNKIWSVGSSKDNINLLLNDIPEYKRNIFNTLDEQDIRSCFDHCIVNAFNTFCKAGPLCSEPVTNCAFIVKSIDVPNENVEINPQTSATLELFIKNIFREAFDLSSPRLMEPIFTTDVQVNTSILGMYHCFLIRIFMSYCYYIYAAFCINRKRKADIYSYTHETIYILKMFV